MRKWCLIHALSLLMFTGCGQPQPVDSPVVGQAAVTVSGDDPFIVMEDGTKIPVDGVLPGRFMQFKVTKYIDENGDISVDIDAVSESPHEPDKP